MLPSLAAASAARRLDTTKRVISGRIGARHIQVSSEMAELKPRLGKFNFLSATSIAYQ
jgi:hypothetical protein